MFKVEGKALAGNCNGVNEGGCLSKLPTALTQGDKIMISTAAQRLWTLGS